MRKKAGLKQYALFGLFAAALVSGACSDDDDAPPGNEAGTGGSSGDAGSSSTAGKSTGGSSTGGSSTGGKNSTGGSSSGGAGSGSGGTSTGGTGQTAGNGGTAGGGTGGTDVGGEGGMMGGEGGMPMGGAGAGNGGDAAGMAGQGGAPMAFATLVNPGFEVGATKTVPTGWTNEGTTGAAYYEYSDWAHSGKGKLTHWIAWEDGVTEAYTARTYQTLDPIENGTYSFSVWVERTGVKTAQYLFAKGHDMNNPTAEATQNTTASEAPDGWVKITLSGIVVTSGKVTLGVYTDNWAGNYVGFDDAEFVKE